MQAALPTITTHGNRYGRANDILDNLLAKKGIRPFIVVMPR